MSTLPSKFVEAVEGRWTSGSPAGVRLGAEFRFPFRGPGAGQIGHHPFKGTSGHAVNPVARLQVLDHPERARVGGVNR